jgi:hypothetical protein
MINVRKNRDDSFGELYVSVKTDVNGLPQYEDKFEMLFGHRRMKNVEKAGDLYMQNIETGELIYGDWLDLVNDLNELYEGKSLESYLFGEKRRGISIVSRNIESELNSKFVKLVKSGVIFCPILSKEVEASYLLENGGVNIDGEIYLLLKGYSLEKERVFTTGNFTYKQKDIEETLSNRNAHLNNAYLSQLVDLEVKYTPVYGFTITKEGLIKVGKVFTL